MFLITNNESIAFLFISYIFQEVFILPEWLHSALRTEFYVKTGVVFMGATLPLTVILTAGPVAILQAVRITVKGRDRKSTRLNSSHIQKSRMPSSA